jgi:hypothetical protein|tara:strand:+ start:1227 stop:4274 length:3048 start_codon:yes stop_codon:yes gene_type:complete
MAAINLRAAATNAVTSSVNTAISTVSASAIASINSNIPGIGSLSSSKVGAALLGGAVGGIFDGTKGAAIGGLLGGSGILGQVQNKLNGIIADAPELQGLIGDPLKIIERGKADLVGLTGELDSLIQSEYRELSDRSSFNQFAGGGFLPSYNDKSSASKIPNPLRDHNSFNYKISLGVLDAAEYNNPESYRSAGGFKNYVIQSSGGNLDKRYQVFDEHVGNVAGNHHQDGSQTHAEYYIDDVELDTVVAPNPNTRVTLGTALSFTVTEPYSMGNFIQAIIGSAKQAGFSTYNSAPFCLKFDFVGWNLDGTTDANFVKRPMFLPIQIINMDMNVTGQGATYNVKAVPMSEAGLADNINILKTAIRATGLRCHEVLETNDASVTSGLNSQIVALEEAGALAPWDRYIVAFPKDRDTLQTALQDKTIDQSAFTTTPEQQEEQRTAAFSAITNPALRASYSPTVITITPPNDTYAILKTFAEDTKLMNAIGLSTLNEDTNAPGNSSEADVAAATNPETGLVDTQSIAAQPADKARDFQFNQNQQITSVIENIVLQTTYAAERSTEGARDGLNKWFKIDTQVFIDDSPITESQLGRRPKVYVYSVMEYEVDEAVTMAGNSRPQNTSGLRDAAVKEYDYIYTGKNEDVLNFDIKFNNAFLMTAHADLGMNAGSLRDTDNGSVAATQTTSDDGAINPVSSDAKTVDEASPAVGFANGASDPVGTMSNDVRRQIAEMFHDRITNMTVDMVTAEMEIMGDPYFIAQESGNYVASRAESPSITQDGTMTYQTGPVFCIVNFRTPFDYQVTGATMEFPQLVPMFSGLFSIWAVTNKWQGGKFTQILKMIRRRGQDDEATTGNSNFVQTDNSVATGPRTTQSDGTRGVSAVGGDNCFPAAQHDDVRQLNPTIGAAEAVQLAAPFVEAEQNLTNAIQGISDGGVQGINFGIAKVPDLTKVIPSLDAFGGIGAQVSGALGDAQGAIGNLENQARAAASQAQLAVNNAANQRIAAATGAAKSRINNLLGPL